MAKRLAIFGTPGGVSVAASGFNGAMAQIGFNVGNAMFQLAVAELVANPRIYINTSSAPSFVRENADVLIFPAANQVNPHWDLTEWAEFIEAVNLPCAVIGLGAQSEIGASVGMNLKPGTMRFIKAIADRSGTMGVRGQFTKDVLGQLGIQNTIVTGCPSRTINRHVTGSSIAAALNLALENAKPRVGYLYGTFEEGTRKAEQKLSSIVKDFDHRIIIQTNPPLMKLVWGGELSPEETRTIHWLGTVARPDLSGSQYVEYLKQSGVFYSDARSWIDQMTAMDAVIGMRIHGAVAAIRGGSLGVCVAFDSRTLELAQTMEIPYLTAQEVEECSSFHEMLTRIHFDPVEYDRKQAVAIDRIKDILEPSGCILSQAL